MFVLNNSNGKLNNHHVHFQNTSNLPGSAISTSTSSSSSTLSPINKFENNYVKSPIMIQQQSSNYIPSIVNSQETLNIHRQSILLHRGSTVSNIVKEPPSLFQCFCENNTDNLSGISDCENYEIKSKTKIWFERVVRLLLSLLLIASVCSSWLVMTFLLQKVVNDQNSNLTLALFELQIATPGVFSCNFCYFLVWLTTSCLIFMHPIYYILHVFFLRFKNSDSKDRYLTKSEIFKNSFKIFDDRSSVSMSLFFSNNSSHRSSFTSGNHTCSTNSSFNNNHTNNNNFKLTSKYFKNFLFKIACISLIWFLTGYAYLKAIDFLPFCKNFIH
jgi:hypothetical protein